MQQRLWSQEIDMASFLSSMRLFFGQMKPFVWSMRLLLIGAVVPDVVGDTNSRIRKSHSARGELTVSCGLAMSACTVAACIVATEVR